MKNWRVYMLRCIGGSLYTGITTDIDRRWEEHCDGTASHYTRKLPPISVQYLSEEMTHSEALKLECKIKRLYKKEKEEICSNWNPSI